MPTSLQDPRSWFRYEEELYLQGYQLLAGIDEAGRGPLAGPVVAACLHMPQGLYIDGVNDSKKLTEKKRNDLFEILTHHPQVHYGIGIVSEKIIDKINILQATLHAMQIAYEEVAIDLDYLLVDGVSLSLKIPSRKIIKGDANSHLIAAASILAKVTRDRIMEKYHQKWPEYDFKSHKGYGTKKHRSAILEYGPCEIHRKTFEPIRSTLFQNGVL